MPKGHIFRQPCGTEGWVMEDRGGFWGPFEERPTHRPYFNGLIVAMLDAMAYHDKLHSPPPHYPFILLGKPASIIRQNKMYTHKFALDILKGGDRLERLLLRLRLLEAEKECFSLLAQLLAARLQEVKP